METDILDAFRYLMREKAVETDIETYLVARAHGRVRGFQSLFQRGALPLGVGARAREV
jgi:hypothetical protein